MILGRVFNTDATKTVRVLVHLSTPSKNGERLFEKFIVPNVGLDMPIYRLTAYNASLELFD